MPGFDQHHAGPHADDAAPIAARNSRYGLWLCGTYMVIYGLFVLINAFWPGWMDRIVWRGVNLAVTYGLGLIVAALVLSAVYGWLCRSTNEKGSA